MKQALAIFELTELDDLTAVLNDLETGNFVARVEDDPDDLTPFQERVKSAAAELGYEVAEWDRRALDA